MTQASRTLLGAMFIAGCAVAAAAQAQAPQPAGVLFENVRVFDGAADRLSAPSNVLVVGRLITAISVDPIAAPPGVSLTRIQGSGRTLMPGLIDNHVHITLSASSQRELLDPKVGPEVLQARATE
jgi:imidazolonepropionase-like amidohydrolase